MKKAKIRGFTLIEILIYMLLLTTILVVVTNFLYQIANFKTQILAESSLFENSSFFLTKIEQDIRGSKELISPVDKNFSHILILKNGEEEISYQIKDGFLTRNDIPLTDSRVEAFFPSDGGFRKIDATIQLKIGLRTKFKPLGQEKKEKIYQTAFLLNFY